MSLIYHLGLMPPILDALDLPFVRTAAIELALLSVSGGVLGAWIVLRRLAFFTHAVGAAALPALVVAGPLGISPQLAGIVAALGFTAGVEPAARAGRDVGAATGLLLVGALATGVMLASDVVPEAGGVDGFLFGSLLTLRPADLLLAAATAVLAVLATLALERAWLAAGFDPGAVGTLPVPARVTDAVLVAIVAVAAVAAVPAVGALLVTSLFVAPAATARLLTSSVRGLVLAAIAIALAQSAIGLALALALDVGPGPAVAGVGALAYAAVAVMARVHRRARP